MKQLTHATIQDRTQLSKDYYAITLASPEIARAARPGQFIMIECKGDVFLKRPMGISAANPKTGTIRFIYRVCGAGTRALHEIPLKDTLEVIGPLGNGFWKEENARSVGLVAGGTGIGPIIMFAHWLHETAPDVVIIGFIGAQSASIICGEKELQQAAKRVCLATDDGTLGDKGFITATLAAYLQNHSLQSLVACGPTPMMQKTAMLAEEHNIPCQVSLEEYMACGFGACLGCACEIRDHGYLMVCREGPVFDSRTVIWNEIL